MEILNDADLNAIAGGDLREEDDEARQQEYGNAIGEAFGLW